MACGFLGGPIRRRIRTGSILGLGGRFDVHQRFQQMVIDACPAPGSRARQLGATTLRREEANGDGLGEGEWDILQVEIRLMDPENGSGSVLWRVRSVVPRPALYFKLATEGQGLGDLKFFLVEQRGGRKWPAS